LEAPVGAGDAPPLSGATFGAGAASRV